MVVTWWIVDFLRSVRLLWGASGTDFSAQSYFFCSYQDCEVCEWELREINP